jgi:hypothetical protein
MTISRAEWNPSAEAEVEGMNRDNTTSPLSGPSLTDLFLLCSLPVSPTAPVPSAPAAGRCSTMGGRQRDPWGYESVGPTGPLGLPEFTTPVAL